MSGGEYQVVLTVIDRTWGFSLLSAPIPLKKFEDSTNLTRQGIIKALKRVEGRHILVCHRNGTKTTEYLFNKHYDTWIMPPSKRELTSEGGESPDDDKAHLVNGGSPTPSEPVFTSEETPLVNQRSPEKSTSVHQNSEPQLTSASKLAERRTEPVKTFIKDTLKDTLKDTYTVVFNHWNSLQIVKHKQVTEKMKTALKSALKTYTKEEICQAMTNYAEILNGEDYFWRYRWTFDEFLRRGLEKFMDIDVARGNYRLDQGGLGDRKQQSRGDAQGIGRTKGYSAQELRRGLRRS